MHYFSKFYSFQNFHKCNKSKGKFCNYLTTYYLLFLNWKTTISSLVYGLSHDMYKNRVENDRKVLKFPLLRMRNKAGKFKIYVILNQGDLQYSNSTPFWSTKFTYTVHTPAWNVILLVLRFQIDFCTMEMILGSKK